MLQLAYYVWITNYDYRTLHEARPDQFVMKFVSKNNWWPHLNLMIHFQGKNCSDCFKAGIHLTRSTKHSLSFQGLRIKNSKLRY